VTFFVMLVLFTICWGCFIVHLLSFDDCSKLSADLRLFSSSNLSSSLFLFTNPGLFSSLMLSSTQLLSSNLFMFSSLMLSSTLLCV